MIVLNSNNFNGELCNIIYYPLTGGTIYLGVNVLPYTYDFEYIYGLFDIDFFTISRDCTLTIESPYVTLTPTPTVTQTPTNTITPSITVTPTVTQTNTPTNTVTPTVTRTPGGTPEPTPSITPTNTPSVTPTISPTNTTTPTPTVTTTTTNTPTPTITPSPTPLPVFKSLWKTSLTSSGSTNEYSVQLPYLVSGTYSGFIDWGDGSISAIN